MNTRHHTSSDAPVVLFDGECNLCNRAVQFILKRDPDGVFRFASLQSLVGQRLLHRAGLPRGLDSIVLIDGARISTRSTAVLAIARRLSGGWPLLGIFRFMPRGLRDLLYDVIAKHRYEIFGRRNECMIPDPELRARFLDEEHGPRVE